VGDGNDYSWKKGRAEALCFAREVERCCSFFIMSAESDSDEIVRKGHLTVVADDFFVTILKRNGRAILPLSRGCLLEVLGPPYEAHGFNEVVVGLVWRGQVQSAECVATLSEIQRCCKGDALKPRLTFWEHLLRDEDY
jgi:hypothetical protein